MLKYVWIQEKIKKDSFFASYVCDVWQEDIRLKTRNVVQLFVRTLAIGGLIGLVTSFFVNPGVYAENMSPFRFMELVGLVFFYLGFGLLSSVISQTGFFAYLYINRFGRSLFRSFWPTVQMLLVAFVAFDLIYFPYKAYDGEVSVFWFIAMSAAIVGIGWFVASIKAKATNPSAFTPALFLMVVMTTIEWMPGLQAEGTEYALLMIPALLACNIYQLMALHRLPAQNPTAKAPVTASPQPTRPAGKKKKSNKR